MGIATDLCDRLSQLETERRNWAKTWDDIAAYALPMTVRTDLYASGGRSAVHQRLHDGPQSAKRTRDVYDSTSLWAIDRLSAGLISLVTPQSETWHGLALDGPFAGEPSDVEQEWLDLLRDFQFSARYRPASGFSIAHNRAIRSMCALGTGILYIEEEVGGGSKLPMVYRSIPLIQCHLADNAQAQTDTNFRVFSMTVRQCVERWGDDCSQQTKSRAEDPRRKDERVQVLHAVMPRAEGGSYGSTNRDSTFASYWVEVEQKHLIGEGGYFEFPYVVYHWSKNEDASYGESPVMLALAEIKSLNRLSKDALTASQQAVRPPMATHDDGLTRLNLNSGAVNPGYVSEEGRLLAQPIIMAQRPDFAAEILEIKRNQIRETLYINLWQILIQNPQMTATEALIRSNEKAELIGPAGSSVQSALSGLADREIGILTRKGAFEPGSPLEPPERLQGESIGVKFTSPLDRLRRAGELLGVQRTVELSAMLAQLSPDKAQAIADRLDEMEIMDLAQEINGAPRRIFRTDDELAQITQQRQAQQALMQGMQGAQMAGEAAWSVAQGADALQESPGARAAVEALTGQGEAA